MLLSGFVVLATLAAMELVAWLSHRYVMHGFGWTWHASHHRDRTGVFERNDLYAIVFAALAIVLIAFGTAGAWPLQWVGAGMTLYGLLYFVAHDGLVHGRWPFALAVPKNGYLKRLVQAHRLHHAVRTQDGAICFAFLVAPSSRQLKAEVQRLRDRRLEVARD